MLELSPFSLLIRYSSSSCTQHQERSKMLQLWEIPYFIYIVQTGVPISFIWCYRVRQRLLQLLPLYFSTVLTELVTWDSGHHPLFLAYLICRDVLRRGRKSWDIARGNHTATCFGDSCRKGMSEQKIISAYIVQSHKIWCVNPWLRFSFCSSQMGFVWSFECAQRRGWMKPAVIRRVLQKSSFLELWVNLWTQHPLVYRLSSQ